ncbi:claudin-11-like [Neosynchiropus ocellatus]
MVTSPVMIAALWSSIFGWLGTVSATFNLQWLTLCLDDGSICEESDVRTQNLWSECVFTSVAPRCFPYLDLPAYVLVSRVLMVFASMLGLAPLFGLHFAVRNKRWNAFILATGLLTLIMAACGLVSTTCFLIGAAQKHRLLSVDSTFYFSWFSITLCLFGGTVLTFYESRSKDILAQEDGGVSSDRE